MKKIVLGYGLMLALVVGLLKVLEYKLLIKDVSLELYSGLLATIFTILGVWIGLKILGDKMLNRASISETKTDIDTAKISELEISNREYEVLVLLAKGHSNKEIADKLFLSENTIKSHCSNLYAKLNVKRRTQAIEKAKQLSIL